ncbi:MAG: HepT-like ribonuclease domain-containing protein [Nostoc sp.]
MRAVYPDVPWQQVAGFRDVLIHDYLKVNLN